MNENNYWSMLDGNLLSKGVWGKGVAGKGMLRRSSSDNLRYQSTITPMLGAELLTDPGLESWATATNLNGWTEEIAGTSTVNKETTTPHGGLAALRLDIDASNSVADVQKIVGAVGWLRITAWLKASVAGKTAKLAYGATGQFTGVYDPGTEWVEYTITGEVSTAGVLYLNRQTAASASLYYDDVSVKNISVPTMLATQKRTPTGDVIAKANLTIPYGLQGGFVVNLADPADPLKNSVWCYIDRAQSTTTKAKLVKYGPDGTRTQLLNTTVTYVENALLELRKIGTAYTIYYNGASAGVEQTISDATIIDNTLHMQFASDPAVRFSFFQCRGDWVIDLPQNLTNTPVIVISFDGGDTDNYTNAYPIMAAQNMVGTVYVQTSLTNTAGFMTPTQLQELQAAGWTVGNHTRNHPDLTTLTQAQQETHLDQGRDDLVSFGITDNGPLHVAYPGGLHNTDTHAAMAAQGMLTGRTVALPTSEFDPPPANVYAIGGHEIVNTHTLAEVKSFIDAIVTNSDTKFMVFHQIVETPSTEYQWSIADYTALMAYIRSKGVITLSTDEFHRALNGPISITHR